jgi:predicted DNA-binding protein (MmcQ/YjbR family)
MAPSDDRAELRRFALAFPDAYEDFPWDEPVVKVGKKIFVFFGSADPARVGVGVKLADSHEEALAMDFTSPMGYGLGRHGWISADFGPGDDVPVPLLCDWIDESYRLLAGKRRVAALDRRAEGSSAPDRHGR